MSSSPSPSPPSSSLTTCCICLERLNPPIKTLPCVHSACSPCIEALLKLGKKPLQCPLCRSPFEVPSGGLQANSFTTFLLSSSSSPPPPSSSSSTEGKGQEAIDPKDLKCEGCDENEAAEYCKDCQMFYCLGCKKPHLRAKATSHHQFASIEEGLKSGSGGSSASSASSASVSRVTRCQEHPQYEVNSFCEKCQVACCSECVVDHHSGHNAVRLAAISQQFKDHISTLMDKVRKHDPEFSQAAKETTNVLATLKKQAKATEEQVRQVFTQLKTLLDERETELLGEIEKDRHHKEKEWIIQKNRLEASLRGLQDSLCFGERLLAEGSGTEIVSSYKPIAGRLETLANDMKKVPTPPATDKIVEFAEGERGVEDARKMIKGFGEMVATAVVAISVERSNVIRKEIGYYGNDPIPIGQVYSIDVVLVDQKGAMVVNISDPSPVEVRVEGPSKNVKVDATKKLGEEGTQTMSFVLDQIGMHEISVQVKGRHLQGSPFKLKVENTQAAPSVFHRDYGLIGNRAGVKFGSLGNEDGQFQYPWAVACNSRGDIIVADTSNNRIQVFDKSCKFLFKFGSYGSGVGQLSNPLGVTVDHRNNNQIVVADYNNNRIQVYDERGGFVRSFGTQGGGDGQLYYPRGIVVDQTNGNYFVADYGNHRVQVFNSNGGYLGKFGSLGDGNGQFNGPLGIGLMASGNIVVGEYGGNRIQIFDTMGNFVQVVSGSAELKTPWHLVVDPDDNILVADFGNKLFRMFNLERNQAKSFGQGQLSGPAGISVDGFGRVIVCEQTSHRVSIF